MHTNEWDRSGIFVELFTSVITSARMQGGWDRMGLCGAVNRTNGSGAVVCGTCFDCGGVVSWDEGMLNSCRCSGVNARYTRGGKD